MLLDTNVMVDIWRGFPPAVAWVKGLGSLPIDLALIGQTAVGLSEHLASFNVKQFALIPGLKIVQPY